MISTRRSRQVLHLSKRSYIFAKSTKPQQKRWSHWFLAVALPLSLWIGYRQLGNRIEQPQALLVLGGSLQREKFAVKFAHQHPNLPIWISSGSPREYAEWYFAESGIAPDRLNLDYRAIDTVTNFTTLADKLQQRGIHSVYLITSDYHMRRAAVIGEIVFGSRGIFFKTVPVPSHKDPESIEKVLRDGGRAILWVTTGHTGARFVEMFSKR
ncbi:MAG: YdcF family protein [Scytolyngbya sp. HA4215-MV1]|nr:YdcF family protein [Scytolyngbya sp. HA4215-MV1]